MNKLREQSPRPEMIFGILPLLVLSNSLVSGLVIGLAFFFSYILVTASVFLRKNATPDLRFSLAVLIGLSICLSFILSLTRIISPFIFEISFLQLSIIPFVPILFNLGFTQREKGDHEWALRELLQALLLSAGIIAVGLLREFLSSFSLSELLGQSDKFSPVLPVLNRPSGAFLLVGILLALFRYLKSKIREKNV